MRTLILSALLAVCCLALSGCMTFDEAHDRKILRYFKRDIMLIHEDLDFIFMLDEENPLEIYMR